MKVGNFLAFNGGGSRTKMEIRPLMYLYEMMGDDFFTHFDIIGGASGGALISSLIAVRKPPKEIDDIYSNHLGKIFNGACCRELIGKSKYSNEYLVGLATELIGNIRLGELNQKIVVPTVNSSKAETKIFKSYDPKDADFKLVDVVVASSSAPRYFPSYEMTINQFINWFKDGGLTSNNPSDILAMEGANKNNGFDVVNILNFTSGENKNIVTKAEKKGNLLSIPEMIDEMLNLQDKKSHGMVRSFYKNEIIKGDYFRYESIIDKSSGSIDDASKKNIILMNQDAEYTFQLRKKFLDEFLIKTYKK